jgi:hypothetical protein
MPAHSRIDSPFFEAPPRAGGRRLLLVSYHFPPDGNVGALRWEMMLRHAATRGWTADVVMMNIADTDAIDRSRLDGLPPGTRLFGVKLPPQPLLAFLQFRQRLVPRERRKAVSASELSQERPAKDQRWAPALLGRVHRLKRDMLATSYYRQWRRWAAAAARLGVALSKATEYEFVVSSGPPHMAHEAARRIAQAASIPLITDFRDPWTSDDVAMTSVKGARWTQLSHTYERLALEASALIVVNTASAERFTKAKYPHLANRVITVMNGADEEPALTANPSSRFTIAYAGSLYGGRSPQPLFRAVRRAMESRDLTSADLLVHFIGVDESQREPLVEMASGEGIGSVFLCETWRPRGEALALLDRASLVVLLPQVHIHSIPAKLYEYVQRAVWILVLSEPGTAIAELLRGSTADVVSPGDVDAIASVIVRRYDESRQGKTAAPLNATGMFSRERQSDLLFAEIERVTNRPAMAIADPRA